MTDKGFLSRWSRRKRTANVSVRSEAAVSEANEGKDESVPPSSKGMAETVEEFDLSMLPSLESISATTDVTAFLRKGVPLALSREALRRAWIADPTIRDFVGLAENAWDFNDPDAMPGFGPLDYTPDELRDLVARIVGGARHATDDIAGVAAPHPGTERVPSAGADRHELPEGADMPAAAAAQIACEAEPCEAEQREPEYVSAQDPDADLRERQESNQRRVDDPSVVRRTHGSALPR
jgi:hypothetical protein